MDALKQKHCSEKCALEEEKGVLSKQIADLEMALGVEKNRSEYVRKALQEALAECDWIEVSKTESFDSTLFVFVAVVHFSNYNFHLLHFRKRNDNSGLKETRWKSSCSFFKPLFYFYFESYSHDPYWKGHEIRYYKHSKQFTSTLASDISLIRNEYIIINSKGIWAMNKYKR